MLNRWIGILAFAAMLTANVALVLRDVIPEWYTGAPPDVDALRLPENGSQRSQLGIYNAAGVVIGNSWTISQRTGDLIRVSTWTVLRPIALPGGMTVPAARIDTMVAYRDATIDSIDLKLSGLDLPVLLKGQFYPPDSFPCQWQVGPQRGSFVLDTDATRALGDVIRPFGRLPGLYVGRTWRVSLLNPLTRLLPGWDSETFGMDEILVRVVAQEELVQHGRTYSVFRVEMPKGRAWVAEDGTVLRQEVDLPLVGRLTLLDEPFDDALRLGAIHAFDD